jgi:hypothetical protein
MLHPLYVIDTWQQSYTFRLQVPPASHTRIAMFFFFFEQKSKNLLKRAPKENTLCQKPTLIETQKANTKPKDEISSARRQNLICPKAITVTRDKKFPPTKSGKS